MAIRSAKDIIRETRIRSGMTQEEMADGICSLQALSRIECGSLNVSPATFEALMRRAGFPHTRFPVFADRDDFECYRSLKYARIHLDAWQLAPAWKELQKIKTLKWAGNKFYYQEWLFLYGRLQFRSYSCSHEHIYNTLLTALRVTRPRFDPDDPAGYPLSKTDLEMVTALAQEVLYLENREECGKILDNIEDCLDDSSFSSMEKARLQAEAALVRVKYLFSMGEYEDAFKLAYKHRRQMVSDNESSSLFELTFLTGLCCLHSERKVEADSLIKSAYYTAHHVDSCYASVCLDYLRRKTSFPVTEQMLRLSRISLKKYPQETFDASLLFLSKTGNADKNCDYTIGDIIRDFRIEQNISQQTLCCGLCSKSKLSKIEGKTLQPDIALTEALLQRLGISERIFTFWGSEKEAKFYDLKFRTMHMRSKDQEEQIFTNIAEMEQLTKEKDILLKQECLVERALHTISLSAKIALLTDALQCTLPKFDIHRITDYRLSWQELNIINSMAHSYGKQGTADGTQMSILYLLQLRDYFKKMPADVALRTNIQPITNYIHCDILYKSKNFNAAVSLSGESDQSIMRYNLGSYSFYLLYYCQALGECKQQEDALFYGALACNINYFMGFYKNVPLLKRYLSEDFNLLIDD